MNGFFKFVVTFVIGYFVLTVVANFAKDAIEAIQDKCEEYQCKKMFEEVYGEIDGRNAA